MTARFRLGVDFGTSSTVAVLCWPDGRVKPLLFDGSPLLPSAVFALPDGNLLVGQEAAHSARIHPERFEPNPKRRVDETAVLLSEAEVPVVDLVAAVLRRVAAESRTVAGEAVVDATLTHPAAWGERRRAVLVEAARRAGLSNRQLVPEPTAAATYFAALPGARVPVGGCVIVYDFGAGTFDASVVRRTGDGFDVLSSTGLPDTGGLDVDAAIVAHLGALYGSAHAEAWRRLEAPVTVPDRRHRRLLWEDARIAKEILSRANFTLIPVPLVDVEAPLGREELETLMLPILERTIATTVAAVRDARVQPSNVAGVFLVGGSSRIPLVATMLHRALGISPTVIEQPELVVAEGSVQATASLAAAGYAPPDGFAGAPDGYPPVLAPVSGTPHPVSAVPVSAHPVSAPAASAGRAQGPAPPGPLPPSFTPPVSPAPEGGAAGAVPPLPDPTAYVPAPATAVTDTPVRGAVAAVVPVLLLALGTFVPWLYTFGWEAVIEGSLASPMWVYLLSAVVGTAVAAALAARVGDGGGRRSAGGLLVGLGLLIALVSQTYPEASRFADDRLGEYAQRFLCLAGPVLLVAVGIRSLVRPDVEEARPWVGVFSPPRLFALAALLMWPQFLFEFESYLGVELYEQVFLLTCVTMPVILAGWVFWRPARWGLFAHAVLAGVVFTYIAVLAPSDGDPHLGSMLEQVPIVLFGNGWLILAGLIWYTCWPLMRHR